MPGPKVVGLSGRWLVRAQRGFTLTELIIVIVIVGILSVGVTRFITTTVGGYVDTAERQQMATAGVTAAERISRELRRSIPNSVRLNASRSCIEYIPILAGTDYIEIPRTAADNAITAVGAQLDSAVSGRAVVYPSSTAALYTPSGTGPITSATATLPTGSNQVTISLSGNHQFLTDSPTRRIYIADSPRALCVESGFLYRYQGYGFNAAAALPPGGGSRAVLLNNISTVAAVFNYTPASLIRNAVVNFGFMLQDGGDSWQTEQEVQIRNVP